MLTQEGLDLLVVNRLNDSKEWYEEHKGEIRRLVIEPFFELITDLGQTMLSIDSEIVIEPKVDRTLSRVYRDTRFTKDKSRYRDCIWLYFRRDKNLYPGYPWCFFELRPYMAWWGCGRYTRDTSYVDATRKMIMDRDPLYLEAKRVVDDSDSYFMLEQDERYKRTMHPDEPEDTRDWLDRRSIHVVHIENDVTKVFTKDLSEKLRRDYLRLVPVYRFLSEGYNRAMH